MTAQQETTRSKDLHINEGPALVATVGVMLALFLGAAYTMKFDFVETLSYVMRPTAWLAFALFIMAFTASSMRILWNNAYGRWAMRNRRYVGLSFALVHFIHAGLVLSNLTFTEATRTVPVLMGGSMAYVFLFLMTITSNNAALRRMGAKNWKRLHKAGSYYIWLIFMATTVPDVLVGGLNHAIIPVVGLMALGLRVQTHMKPKQKKR